MAYFEVQKALKEQEKAKEGKIFLTAAVANDVTEVVNKATSNKDLAGAGIVYGGNKIPYVGDTGLADLIKDSYENFYKGITPKEQFRVQAGVSYKGVKPPTTQLRTQLGNLETAHMLRLKKAFENLELRMALKRKSDALKRKSSNLTISRSAITKLKADITRLIGLIEIK